MPAEPRVSVEDVARELGVSLEASICWTEGKGLPADKAGGLWKFGLADVGEWVRSGASENSACTKDHA